MNQPFTVRILTGRYTIDVPCASQAEADTIKQDALVDGYYVTEPDSRIIDVPLLGAAYVLGGVEGFQRPEN